MVKVRVWDLPTRLFHWLLVTAVVGLVVTGNVGGNWINWHMRLGYLVFSLVLFRLVWGVLGGQWSRFSQFVPSPRRLLAYLRGTGDGHSVGHNPLGALSVLALLTVLSAQVASGLMTDDEIAFTGPLVSVVSSETVSLASWYHSEVGKLVMLALIALHVSAIVFYGVVKKQRLVRAMVTGDQETPLPPPVESRDNLATRLLALGVWCCSAGVVYAVVSLGSTG
jgi:cytochrome b